MSREEIIAEVAKRHGVLLEPDDPVLQIATMLEVADNARREREHELLALPDEVSLRIAPALARMATFTAAAEQAANRPLLTGHQLRHDLLPKVLGAAYAMRDIILFLAGVVLALSLHWWLSPPERCDAEYNGRLICYRDNGPAPQMAPPPQVPAPSKGGRQ